MVYNYSTIHILSREKVLCYGIDFFLRSTQGAEITVYGLTETA